MGSLLSAAQHSNQVLQHIADTHIHAATDKLANMHGIPMPNSMKALLQLFSQRCAQCMANERAGAGGRSPGLWMQHVQVIMLQF